MNNTLTYKGYTALVEYDSEDMVLRGRILGIKDKIVFYILTPSDAETEFHNALDDYLEFCEEQGVAPDKPYNGKLSIRLPHQLHKALAIAAQAQNQSINSLACCAIEEMLYNKSDCPTCKHETR